MSFHNSGTSQISYDIASPLPRLQQTTREGVSFSDDFAAFIINTTSPKHNMAEANGAISIESRDPSTFLTSIIGVPVTVKLNSGIVYKGELQSVDGYMNIALEKCQEFVNGTLRRSYGDAFVRGNNVLYISSE